jgi:NAD(P)-dependent dehydrogenase (short-subunit alcohol dehydrogenase family)
LATKYQLKLHLIGTAPAPQITPEWRKLAETDMKLLRNKVMQTARSQRLNPLKEWQAVEKAVEIENNLRELRELGLSVRYYQCDVADRDELAAVLKTIRSHDGPIEGVLHGAGYGKDSRFDQKEAENVDKCFRAKIDGAIALMELTRHDPLKYFVSFGSISGRFGANGHTDYSAANDMLARLTNWYRCQRPEVAAVAFHWHAWGDIGMATKPETRLALEMVNMQFMPAAEGLQHLISELEAGAPEAEVLVTDEKYYRSFFPAETLISEIAKPNSSACVQRSLPLLDASRIVQQRGQVTCELTLNPVKEPFLIEHRLDDRPLLPMVVGLELMCEAAQAAGLGPAVRLKNVEALHGLKFHTVESQVIRVKASE